MEKTTLNIKDIKVPEKMLGSRPKRYKVMGMEVYLKKSKHFYGSVIVNKDFKILDGYVIYYVAKKNKIKEVPVTIVTIKDRIKHFFRKRGK